MRVRVVQEEEVSMRAREYRIVGYIVLDVE